MKFGIVGLGLMGGSLGKTLKKYKFTKKILGFDHNLEHQKQAKILNLVDEICTIEQIKTCDIIILAIPVDSIIKFLDHLSDIHPKTTIIDFGSTKEKIISNIPKLIRPQFIASHPMTGTEKFGPQAAIDNLYENKIMAICNIEQNNQFHKKRALNLFKTMNMNLVHMNATDHDNRVCYMSHLPHAISFGLANTVMDNESPRDIIALAAGGFKDMSRVAKSSPKMWNEIFKQNRENLLNSINIFNANMNIMKKMLEDEDYEGLDGWIKKANTLHTIL